jgi:hypothetical protein
MVMAALLIPLIVILVVLVLAAILARRFTHREVERSDELRSADRPSLRYLVPPGQDPAVVVLALEQAGYVTSPDSESGASTPIVAVGPRAGETLDREAVRATLMQTSGTNIVPEESAQVERRRVLFQDEYPGRT